MTEDEFSLEEFIMNLEVEEEATNPRHNLYRIPTAYLATNQGEYQDE